MDLNISHTRTTLFFLNKELKKKCGNTLSVEFGNYQEIISEKNTVALYDKYDNFQLLLCLNKHSTCIATISCKINSDGSMEISSKTNPNYEGRKYNLLLRCAIVLLAPSIFISRTKKVTSILSKAINPISILLMAKYFRATNDELDHFIQTNDLSYPSLTLENMQQFYDELNEMPEFETDEEELFYLENQKSFGNPVLLSINVNDTDIINHTKQLYAQLIIKCPDSIVGGKKRASNKKYKRRRYTTRRGKICYSTYNPFTHRVFSKCTTRNKSIRQQNYLDDWLGGILPPKTPCPKRSVTTKAGSKKSRE